ncbi:MAG: UDP-3-O-(3-hydroxymyristoyl)glucosamine N-acyltransferase [Bacteroidota bacterium]
MTISAKELAFLLKGTIEGNPDAKVETIAKIEEAHTNAMAFLGNPKYEEFAYSTKAGILMVSKTFQPTQPIAATLLKVDDPYQSLAFLMEKFASAMADELVGIDEKASINNSATIGQNVYVGACAVIEKNAKIGNNVKIHPQVFIGEGVEVGDNTILYPGVKIYKDSKIGTHCIFHCGVVIGSDGFGFAPQADGSYQKVNHLGNVVVEDNVEIGANTSIDKGSIGSTIIHKGVKLDNLVHIAHNVEIGENTVIAAQSGVAGSTKIGKNCMIGGQVGIVGHIKIADGTKINAQSGVSKTIEAPKTAVTGSPAFNYTSSLRSQAVYRKLPDLEQRIIALEKLLSEKV